MSDVLLQLGNKGPLLQLVQFQRDFRIHGQKGHERFDRRTEGGTQSSTVMQTNYFSFCDPWKTREWILHSPVSTMYLFFGTFKPTTR